MGLFTALTGSIAFAVYAVVAGVLDGLKNTDIYMGCCLWCYRSGCFRGCFSCCMLRITAKWGGTVYQGTPV